MTLVCRGRAAGASQSLFGRGHDGVVVSTFQHHDGDLPAGGCLELGERRHERDLFRPDALALGPFGGSCYDRELVGAHLDRGLRMRHQVAIPRGVMRTSTVGGEHGNAVFEWLVHHRIDPLALSLDPDMVHQDDRNARTFPKGRKKGWDGPPGGKIRWATPRHVPRIRSEFGDDPLVPAVDLSSHDAKARTLTLVSTSSSPYRRPLQSSCSALSQGWASGARFSLLRSG